MKYCTRGMHEVDLSLFSKSSKSKDGLSVWCKVCFAAYERERYANGDRERKELNKKKTQEKARDYIWSVLTASSCVDCGNSDPMVLEFDHRDDSGKSYNICEMYNLSIGKIKEEISKCEVRCANCHKRRTAIQFGFWRTLR